MADASPPLVLESTPVGIRLQGAITLANANRALKDGLAALTQHPAPCVALDLSGLEASHTITLAVITQWYRHLHAMQRSLYLTDVPIRLHAIMQSTGLDAVLTHVL